MERERAGRLFPILNDGMLGAMMESHSMEVNFLGQRIRLKSSETGSQSIREVADFVMKKLGEAEERSRGGPAQQAALIALLDLAEEYLSAKKKTDQLLEAIRANSQKLEKLIETQFT